MKISKVNQVKTRSIVTLLAEVDLTNKRVISRISHQFRCLTKTRSEIFGKIRRSTLVQKAVCFEINFQ